MSEATDRIEASRARLKMAMWPTPRDVGEGDRTRSLPWLNRLAELPLVSAVIDSVTSWWSHHPMRPVAKIAHDASTAVVKPIARSNPLTFVLVAAVIGAGLAWSRPWRLIFRSALLAGLLPQLALRVVSSLPIESWTTMAGAAMSRRTSAQRAGQGASAPGP